MLRRLAHWVQAGMLGCALVLTAHAAPSPAEARQILTTGSNPFVQSSASQPASNQPGRKQPTRNGTITRPAPVSPSRATRSGSGQTAAGAGSSTAAININTADAATLDRVLKGIGQVKAQAIVEYRQANGPFATVDDLDNVKGIGRATIDKNRALMRVR